MQSSAGWAVTRRNDESGDVQNPQRASRLNRQPADAPYCAPPGTDPGGRQIDNPVRRFWVCGFHQPRPAPSCRPASRRASAKRRAGGDRRRGALVPEVELRSAEARILSAAGESSEAIV